MAQPPDIDRLVQELNDAALPQAGADTARLEAWLTALVARKASDLFLVAGAPPSLRVNGEVVPLDGGPLDGVDIEEAVLPALSARQAAAYREHHSIDASIRVGPRARFRLNLHRERGRGAATVRALPTEVPRLDALNFPLPIALLSRLSRGLVLVCGPTGSGKTTTLASLVDDINRRERRHIITIEDPIEYEHQHGSSIVEHQEVGTDVPDFASALRSAVRQAPDILVVGEMRDAETMRLALGAAETGHLVLTTLHATDAASAVARIIDSFPAERQGMVRQELAVALAAVLTQRLLPRVDGSGRVPAAELLVASYGARQHVRKSAFQHLHQEIAVTRRLGSFSLEEALAQLVRQGVVERAEAATHAAHPDELDTLIGAAGLPDSP